MYQCVEDGGGCFKVVSDPVECVNVDEPECPYYAKQVSRYRPGACCPGLECGRRSLFY